MTTAQAKTDFARRPRADSVTEFNKEIRTIVNKLERWTRSDEEAANIDRFRKRMNLLKTTIGQDAIIKEVAPYAVKEAHSLFNLDPVAREARVRSFDIRLECAKHHVQLQQQDGYLLLLSRYIQLYYLQSSQVDRDALYLSLCTTLRCCMEYQSDYKS